MKGVQYTERGEAREKRRSVERAILLNYQEGYVGRSSTIIQLRWIRGKIPI